MQVFTSQGVPFGIVSPYASYGALHLPLGKQATVSTSTRTPLGRWNMKHSRSDAVARTSQVEYLLLALYTNIPGVCDGCVIFTNTASVESPKTLTSVGALQNKNVL